MRHLLRLKQYFTGFFTALCLSASFVLFVGSHKKSLGSVVVDSIIVKGDDGSMTTIIGSGMITYNTNGKQSCYVGTADQGGGVIRTSNINGKETCYLGANILSNGELIINNNKGNTIVWMGSIDNKNHMGDGGINLFDRYGDFGWGASGKE